METNRVAPEWDCKLYWSDCIPFNESYVASVIAALTLRKRVLKFMLTLTQIETSTFFVNKVSWMQKKGLRRKEHNNFCFIT